MRKFKSKYYLRSVASFLGGLRIGTAYKDANRNKGAWKKDKRKEKKKRKKKEKKEFITHKKKSLLYCAFRPVPLFRFFSPNFLYGTGDVIDPTDARCCRNASKHRRDRLQTSIFPSSVCVNCQSEEEEACLYTMSRESIV